MEEIKMQFESKYWEKAGEWCVAITLPEFEYWSESCWDADREKAKKRVIELAKVHIDHVRELRKPTETSEEILKY